MQGLYSTKHNRSAQGSKVFKCDCRARGVPFACDRLHFQRLIFPWTDLSLGNCSYLDTCRHMKSCRYVHYQLDDGPSPSAPPGAAAPPKPTKQAVPKYLEVSLPSFPRLGKRNGQ